jgi:hypothetical protein
VTEVNVQPRNEVRVGGDHVGQRARSLTGRPCGASIRTDPLIPTDKVDNPPARFGWLAQLTTFGTLSLASTGSHAC